MNAYTAVIRSMNIDGYSPEQISAELDVPQDEVTAIVAAVTETDAAGQPAPAPLAEAMPEVADLLAWAAAHDDKKVRADGEQAATVLAALRERRTIDAELEKITSEENQLEERLAALRARKNALQPPRAGGKRQRPDRDYEPGEVRTWARQNGYEVPDRGQIPKKILDAWRERENGTRPLAVVS